MFGARFLGNHFRRLAAILLVSQVFFVACGPSQEEYDAERARANRLQAGLKESKASNAKLEDQVGALEAQNAELASRLRALGENVEALEGDRANLETRLAETRKALEELRERERQAQARLATFKDLIKRFSSMIESGQLRVRIVRNRMVVELPEGILFDSGRAKIKRSAYKTLSEVTKILASLENRSFQIAGHTDNVPISTRRFPSNWELSAARAVNVARYMAKEGMPAERLSAAGYADAQPVASNDTKEGRQQNRRIEIVLQPNLDELPDLSGLQAQSG